MSQQCRNKTSQTLTRQSQIALLLRATVRQYVSTQIAALTDGFRDSDDGDRYFLFSEFFVEKVRPSMRPITTCYSTRQ